VSIYFDGLHIGMPHELLDDTNVYPVFEQMNGGRVLRRSFPLLPLTYTWDFAKSRSMTLRRKHSIRCRPPPFTVSLFCPIRIVMVFQNPADLIHELQFRIWFEFGLICHS
jgi:hypothetical protein